MNYVSVYRAAPSYAGYTKYCNEDVHGRGYTITSDNQYTCNYLARSGFRKILFKRSGEAVFKKKLLSYLLENQWCTNGTANYVYGTLLSQVIIFYR